MNIESFWEYRAVQEELHLWYDSLKAIDEEIHESPVHTEFTGMDSRRFFGDWLTELWASL